MFQEYIDCDDSEALLDKSRIKVILVTIKSDRM